MPTPALRRVTAVLCATEIVSWGVLYYAFPVVLADLVADTGWPMGAVVAAFSLSQVVAGVTGVGVGRWIDAHGPRGVMTAGSGLAVVAVAGMAATQNLAWFVAAWLMVGVACAATLYAPAFAALTHWGGADRVKALTAVTLVAGLASTVFAPLTAVLLGPLGWRDTYGVLAAILLITVPMHWWGLRHPWPGPHHRAEPTAGLDGPPVWRSGAFLALTAAICLAAAAIYAGVINLVPMLLERGLSTESAAVVLGVGGVGQVCGRLGYRRLEAATSVRTRTTLVVAAVAATTLLLAVVPGPYALLAVVSFLAGTARGACTLIQATAVTDRWGVHRYGTLNGLLSAPLMFAVALSPWLGTVLAENLGGYPAAFGVLAGLAVAATLLTPLTMPRRPVLP
ncbi:MFS transporter [Mumia zhuanghuii]|uniref:MFS transporter n=1 Tax=Mumia zhuanghuii TaxID=2585211 RepID=A0A5Q6S552_9ACTN|nr:MFS transporter [Mumia zhuanghuii]